jgi:hypothetical protein
VKARGAIKLGDNGLLLARSVQSLRPARSLGAASRSRRRVPGSSHSGSKWLELAEKKVCPIVISRVFTRKFQQILITSVSGLRALHIQNLSNRGPSTFTSFFFQSNFWQDFDIRP